MTIEEVFGKLATHMREGVMFHDTMAKAFDFLDLEGFWKLQEHQYREESDGYLTLIHYYTSHYFRIARIGELQPPKVIPDLWFNYSTQAVDNGTKKNAIKELLNKWIIWEKETKKLYEEMYLELTNLREVAAAQFLENFIDDVSEELVYAEKLLIKMETIGYDMIEIISYQEPMLKEFGGDTDDQINSTKTYYTAR